MSSILKALKKAEQESRDPENRNRHPFILNTRSILNSNLPYPHKQIFLTPKKIFFLLGVTFLMASVSYILLIQIKPLQPGPPSHPIIPVPSLVTPSRTPAGITEQNTAIGKADTHPTLHAEPLTPQKEHIEKKTFEQIPKPVEKHGPTKKDEILFLKDDALNIQAISWTENSSDRVAVINNKIVGEGESVSGYHILEIGPDDIILQLGDQKFRIIFNYR